MKLIKSLFIVVSILSMVGCGSVISEDFINKTYVACEDHGGLSYIDDSFPSADSFLYVKCNDSFGFVGSNEIRKQWAKKKLKN